MPPGWKEQKDPINPAQNQRALTPTPLPSPVVAVIINCYHHAQSPSSKATIVTPPPTLHQGAGSADTAGCLGVFSFGSGARRD